MANTKDINSTERLLNVIRGISKPGAANEEASENSSKPIKTSNKQTSNLSKTLIGKHRFIIGVDIGPDYINLAKTAKTSDGKQLLVDQKIIKYSNQPPISASEFTELLRSSLTSFAGSMENCEIWTAMNASDANVHHIKIPRVPKKQLDNVIYWTSKKENPIDDKEVIFDYEIQGDIIDQGIPKYSVMVYSAQRSEVERIKALFSSAGINLTGITAAPFAIQNIFRTKWIHAGESTFASLFIGNDFSRIDVYKNQNLVMTRGIKTGISSMMDVIDESISETSPEDRPRKEEIKKLLNNLLYHPEKTKIDSEGMSWFENGIFEMIAPVLERLIRQIERTLEYYVSSVGYERVEKLYVTSIINVFYRPFLSYISEQLGAKAEFFDPYEGQGASSAGSTLSPSMRSALVPAIGLALSERKHTPNIIFTYVEKNKEISQNRINRAIFATFGIVLVLCMAVLFFQVLETKKISDRRVRLEQELASYHPILTKDTISGLANDIKIKRDIHKQYAKKYKSLALIGEVSALTPSYIKLIRIKMTEAPAVGSEQKKDTPGVKADEAVVIEGVVLGDRSSLDSLLGQYVMTLENSPMLQSVSLQKSSAANYRKKEIIQFTIHAKIG